MSLTLWILTFISGGIFLIYVLPRIIRGYFAIKYEQKYLKLYTFKTTFENEEYKKSVTELAKKLKGD